MTLSCRLLVPGHLETPITIHFEKPSAIRGRPPHALVSTLFGVTSVEHVPRADLLLASRADRINDELDQAAADGWLVYDFRGSNPAFGRLLGAALPSSTRRAFLYMPRRAAPRLLIHHVD